MIELGRVRSVSRGKSPRLRGEQSALWLGRDGARTPGNGSTVPYQAHRDSRHSRKRDRTPVPVDKAVGVPALRDELSGHRRYRHVPGVDHVHTEAHAIGDTLLRDLEFPGRGRCMPEVHEVIFPWLPADARILPTVDGVDPGGRALLEDLPQERDPGRALALEHATLAQP